MRCSQQSQKEGGQRKVWPGRLQVETWLQPGGRGKLETAKREKKQKQRHHLLLHCDDEFQTKAFECRHLIIWKCLSLLSQCTNKNAKLQLLTVNMNAIDAQQINVLLMEMR